MYKIVSSLGARSRKDYRFAPVSEILVNIYKQCRIVQAVNAREIRGSFIVRGVDISSETPTYRTKVHIRWLNPAQK